MEISIKQALENLFNGARQAKLTADEHVIIQKSKKILEDVLFPKKVDTIEPPMTNADPLQEKDVVEEEN